MSAETQGAMPLTAEERANARSWADALREANRAARVPDMWGIVDRYEATIAAVERERDEARRALEEIRDFQPVTSALDAELDEARKASQECAECKRLRAIPYGVLTACSEHYDLRARIETRIYHEEAYQAKWRLKEIARAALAARPAETPEGR